MKIKSLKRKKKKKSNLMNKEIKRILFFNLYF